MTNPSVTVIDYGMGNLFSVTRALEHCGADVTVSADPDVIRASSRVVLPGVGAFGDGMAELRRLGLDEVVKEVAASGRPLLGICLGMQMLLDESEEFGLSEGLGLIPGRVVPVPATTMDGKTHKIPHIGWEALVLSARSESWEETLLQGTSPGTSVYFVHSYMAMPSNPELTIADCIYDGVRVTAVIARGNVVGCQFHPEKSGEAGLAILKAYLCMT